MSATVSPRPLLALRLFERDSSPRVLREFVEQVYFRRRLAGHSPLSLREHLGTVNLADRLCQASEKTPTLLDHLNDEWLATFVAWLLGGQDFPAEIRRLRPLANPTVNKHLTNLRAQARLAAELGEHAYSITFKDLPEPKRAHRCWRREEMGCILEACGRWESSHVYRRRHASDAVPDGLILAAIIWVMYATGVRLDALMQTKRAKYDSGNSVISIRGEDQKDREDLVRKLPPEACEALRQIDLVAAGREQLIPFSGDPCGDRWTTLRRTFSRLLVSIGLPHERADKFHKIRRTFATYTAAAIGLDRCRELLGHSDIKTTRGYIDWTIYDELAQPYQMLPPIFSGNSQGMLFP